MLKKRPKNQNLVCNGKRFRTIEQLYNYKTEGRTMTVEQAMWFLEDNKLGAMPSGKRHLSALGRVDLGPDMQPL